VYRTPYELSVLIAGPNVFKFYFSPLNKIVATWLEKGSELHKLSLARMEFMSIGMQRQWWG
jgi:hypothetical protein